jgi:hypothetical protein
LPQFGSIREYAGPSTSLGVDGRGNILAPVVNQISDFQLIVFIDCAIPTPENPTTRSEIQTSYDE